MPPMTHDELVKRCVIAVAPYLSKNDDGTSSFVQLWMSWIATRNSPDPVATAEAILASRDLRESFGSVMCIMNSSPPDPPQWLMDMANHDPKRYKDC
jgi:hypothetical protein